MKHKVAELEGAQIGDLLVVRRAGSDHEGRRVWACACSCGAFVHLNTKQITANRLDYCQSVYHRLIRQTVVAPGTNCWLWQGKVNRSGYGVCNENGLTRVAHRVMYRAVFGEFDPELRACHRCDTPACINPFHIFLGTQRENMRDMHAKGRFGGGAKPGNRNAVGNKGWMRGGIVKMRGYVASKFGDVVDLP